MLQASLEAAGRYLSRVSLSMLADFLVMLRFSASAIIMNCSMYPDLKSLLVTARDVYSTLHYLTFTHAAVANHYRGLCEP